MGGGEREGGDSIGQANEKKDQDRSVTPLDLVGLTFECFVDSTGSREEWEKGEEGEEGLTGAIVVFILSFFHRILWVFVKLWCIRSRVLQTGQRASKCSFFPRVLSRVHYIQITSSHVTFLMCLHISYAL